MTDQDQKLTEQIDDLLATIVIEAIKHADVKWVFDAPKYRNQIFKSFKEAGYTRQPEPQEELNPMSLEAMVNERDKLWGLYQTHLNRMKEMVSGPPQELEPKPRFDSVFDRGAENMEKPEPEISPYEIPHAAYDKHFTPPEPPIDKVEVVKHILEEHSISLDSGKIIPARYYDSASREILKLLPEYELVELEPLGDEEIKEVRFQSFFSEWHEEDSQKFIIDNLIKKTSQATIRHNQAKGQLFRLKKG